MDRRIGVLCLAAAIALLAGCGQRDAQRFSVRGTVTFQGHPVKKGAVSFEPTLAAGKEAPTVYLPITDGQFYTSAREGPGKGRYTVVVTGWDPAKEFVDNDGITHVTPLFTEYRFEVEIPVPKGRLDIVVPDSQALTARR